MTLHKVFSSSHVLEIFSSPDLLIRVPDVTRTLVPKASHLFVQRALVHLRESLARARSFSEQGLTRAFSRVVRVCLFDSSTIPLTWARWIHSGRISCVEIREMVKVISFNLTSSRGGVTATEDGDESPDDASSDRNHSHLQRHTHATACGQRPTTRCHRRRRLVLVAIVAFRGRGWVFRDKGLTKRVHRQKNAFVEVKFSAPSACCRRDERFGGKIEKTPEAPRLHLKNLPETSSSSLKPRAGSCTSIDRAIKSKRAT